MYEIETTKEVGIMASSPIFKDILHYMDNIILNHKLKNDQLNKKKKTPKFVMYSGHDYIIAAVQLYLNAAFNISCFYPGFAANQFFELHKQNGIEEENLNENHFHVEYFFNGNLLINVSYTEFKRKISELMWSMEQIVDFCKVEKHSFVDYLLYFALSFSIISITIAMIKDNLGDQKRQNISKNRYQMYKDY